MPPSRTKLDLDHALGANQFPTLKRGVADGGHYGGGGDIQWCMPEGS